jgi:RHS repeat-associated protein
MRLDLRYFCALSFCLVVSTNAIQAQDLPDVALGLQPYVAYHGGGLDSVSTMNGSLTIHIPLVSYPQRGSSLALSYSVIFNSFGFQDLVICDATPDPNGPNDNIPLHDCPSERVNFIPTGVSASGGQLPIPPRIVVDQQLVAAGTREQLSAQVTNPPVDGRYYVVTADGAQHPLGRSGDGIHFRSVDEQGYMFVPSAPTAYPSNLGTLNNAFPGDTSVSMAAVGGTITDSHGNVYAQNSLTDVDGNAINFSAGTGDPAISMAVLDSTNRQIPGSVSTDLSHCPWVPGTALQSLVSASQWAPPGTGSTPFYFCYASVKIRTDYSKLSKSITQVNRTETMLQSIILPNGQFWGFVYDAADPNNSQSFGLGELMTLIYPTGGSVNYTYGVFGGFCNTFRPSGLNPAGASVFLYAQQVQTRTMKDSDGTILGQWTYGYPDFESGSQTATGTILSPPSILSTAGDLTVTKFQLDPNSTTESDLFCHFLDAGKTVYQGSSATGTPLQDTTTAYIFPNPPGLPSVSVPREHQTTTVLDGLSSSTITKDYDPTGISFSERTCLPDGSGCVDGSPAQVTIGGPTLTTYTDFTGAVLKKEATTYQWRQNPSYLSANLLGLPYMAETEDASGTPVASTTYSYDETNYSQGGTKGHLTTTSSYLNVNSGPAPTTHTGWSPSGEKAYFIDADVHTNNLGHTTDYQYNSQCNGSVLTDTYDALNQHISGTYDCNTGLLTGYTDANGKGSSFVPDAMRRIKAAYYPDGGSTLFNFDDAHNTVTRTIAATPDPAQTTTVVFDSFGREIQRITSDSPQPDTIDTTYDANGRVYSVTNPYRSTSDPTYGLTTYTYDALNRKRVESEPDGSSLKWSYVGNTTTSIDENLNSWVRTSDSLGRLTNVAEPGGLATGYTYDTLSNLHNVTQSGVTGESPRIRSFTYDSLSRLLTASNPETGTICYGQWSGSNCVNGYDANGNLKSKTDARGVTSSYSYDALNRLISKQYTDSTPSACFQYDATTVNGIGHLASEWTQPGACPSAGGPSSSALTKSIMGGYDAMGRLKVEQQCPWGGCSSTNSPTLQYGYDLAGNRTSFTDAAGTTLSTSYDNARHPSALTSTLWDVNHPQTVFLGNSYGPMGLLTSALGNGIYEVRSYTNRGWIQSYSASHASNSQTPTVISGYVDAVRNHEDGGNGLPQNGLLDVLGWAYNSSGCPLANVEVDLDSESIGLAGTNGSRPDVQQALGGGSQYANCGWAFTGSIGEATPGTHTVKVFGLDSDGNRGLLNNQYQITVSANSPPVGSEDAAVNPNDNSQNVLSGGLIYSYGWAIDSQMRAPVGAVKVLVDGTPIGFATLGGQRPDIASEMNDQRYLYSGWNFEGTIGNLSLGTHTVSSVIYDTGGNRVAPQTPRQISIVADPNTIAGDFAVSSPTGGQMVSVGGTLALNGWAFESNYVPCATITRVEVWIDSKLLGTAQIGIARQDVVTAFQNQNCLNSGFSYSGPITGVDPGPHLVFVRAYDHSGGSIQLQPTIPIVVSGTLPSSSVANPLPTQYSFALGYAPNGNVSSSSDSVNGNWSYLYDNLNRLIAAGSAFQNSLAWSYDSFGNMLSQTVTGGYGIGTEKSFSQASNRSDQVCYDAAGNQLDDWGCNGGGIQQFAFDAEERMSSSEWNGTQYIYDAEGRRVAKQSGGQTIGYYLYDNEGHHVADLDGGGNFLRRQIYLGGGNIATYDDQQHTTIFALSDWLGTQRARVDMTSTICQTTISQPFGDNQQINGTCSPSLNFFTGKERDTESGLDYFGARYYASNMGRFMSPDWAAKATPVPYAKLSNPQSLNLYSYVGNNPLRAVDPDGHADVAAACKGQSTCNVTVTDTVNIVHYDKKSGTSVVDSTLKVTTNFSVTTDAKGNMSASASATVSNVSGHAYSDGQLATMGKDIGAVQGAAVTMGFGANTTQMMTAVGAGETAFGTARAGESSPFKAPDINPLQLSGGRANGDLMHNIQGALNVFDYFGRKVDFDPIPTYRGYSDGSVPTMSNFTAIYNSVSETQK